MRVRLARSQRASECPRLSLSNRLLRLQSLGPISRSENGEYCLRIRATVAPWSSTQKPVIARRAPEIAVLTADFMSASHRRISIAGRYARRVLRSAKICAFIRTRQRQKAQASGPAYVADRNGLLD